jgi:TonB-linked SusC/RagA family outer membrane protein
MEKKNQSYHRWFGLLLFFCLATSLAYSQRYEMKDSTGRTIRLRVMRNIVGSVQDSTGAMSGVSVSVKGKSDIGTTTDLNGKYVLDVPDGDVVLVFTMIGYATQEIPLKKEQGYLIVNMKRASSSMDDVVVIGFSKQRKKDVVGSVTTINPAELKVPSSNLTTALAGRLTGIIAYQRSGEPGQDNAEFFIRGATTFGYKKDPLILIDGIEYSATELARLQPDDIAQFSILKDATASAVYGARGANGVILVTTKEGKAGKMRINVRLENSIASPTKDVELADPVTYMELHNESYLTRGVLELPYLQSQIDNTKEGVNKYMYPATDWKKELFKKSTNNQRGNFSVSGGGALANYFIAGSFTQDNGILKVDKRSNFNSNINLKTYNLRSNIGIKVTKSTDVMVRLYGSFDDYTGPIAGGTGLYRNTMRTTPVLFPAYYPVDEEHFGVNHILFGNYDRGQYLNPYANMVSGYKDSKRSLMVAQFEVKQNLAFITEGLNLRVMTNTNRQSFFDISRAYIPFWYSAGGYDKLTNTYHLTGINPDQGTDFLQLVGGGERQVVSTFYLESALNYNRTFNKHGVSAMVISIIRSQSESGATSLQQSLPFRNLGVSGRATYNYDSRYFAEFNFGYNGSERFYKSERFGFFPSIGAAWLVSEENFLKDLYPTVSKLKLRGNYGMTGNDKIGSADDRFFYLSEVRIGAGPGASFGTDGSYTRPGVTVDRYENYDITWETAVNSTFGVELGLFNKVEIIAEYFTEKRKNILMDRTLPATLGLEANPKANVGRAQSRSIEFSIDYNENIGKKLFIATRANFTYSRNRFVAYEEPLYNEWYKSRIGWPVNQQWGYVAERLFVDDEEVDNSPDQTFGGRKAMGGDIKFRDVNGDGVITDLDQVPIGFPTNPEIVYGFGVQTKYKGVDFSFFFQGSARSSFWIDPRATAPFVEYRYGSSDNVGVALQNQLLKAYADDHWSEENRNLYALWPRLSSDPVQNATGGDLQTNNTQRSTWFMRSGDFLRLKQVELGYSLSPKAAKRIRLESLRIYTNATNLVTFSKFKLWDVEMGGNGLGYPIQKVINFGIQVGL